MVHSMFGYTLMLAGLARLIEVCFVAPSYARDTPEEDNASDHTLRDSPLSPQRYRGVNAFLHLTPFVSSPNLAILPDFAERVFSFS